MPITDRQKKEGAIEIGPDTAEQPELLIDDDEANGAYHVEVYDEDIRIGHDQTGVQGRTLSAGVTHTVTNLRGQPLYAKSLGGTAYARVIRASAEVDSQPTRDVNVDGTEGALPVEVVEPDTTSVESFRFDLSGGVEQLDPNTVPAGVQVVVQAHPDNSAPVEVGSQSNPVMVLDPGVRIVYDVVNTDQIGVNGTAGDQVNVTHEVI